MENNLESWCERLLEMQFEVYPIVFRGPVDNLTGG
jgi:hypothetical protein